MTPEQIARLRHKRWLNKANTLRKAIRNTIAPILRKSSEEIQFTDFALTKEIRSRFAEEINGEKEIIVPNRSAAIDLVKTRLGDVNCLAFLLINGCDESGMVKLDFKEAIIYIDDILKSQKEYIGIISHDGDVGACITVEEGIGSQFPRCVVLWNKEKRTEGMPLR